MFDFTTEQVEFLESSGKVVLHACPGSGKTTIVARKLANYLQCWNRPHQGIAVLSFTNVASDEIRHQATEMLPEGYCVDDPHFIGTLDSFIDNFIFLRFGYLNRARTQFKLTSGMEENWDAMQKVIEKYC